MKIYASRKDREDIDIIKDITGKDIWIKTTCHRRPSFYMWLKIIELRDFQSLLNANYIQQSKRNNQFLTSCNISLDRERILQEELCESVILQLDDFSIERPIDCCTTEELIDLVLNNKPDWEY